MTTFVCLLIILIKNTISVTLSTTAKREFLREILKISSVNEKLAEPILMKPEISLESIQALSNIYKLNDKNLKSEQSCDALNLNSKECYYDCIYYSSPLLLINELQSNNSEWQQVLSWYQMSGGPLSYMDVGNPDMCIYNYGTYCYMNANIKNIFTLMEHGCCVPGTCKGQDAIKVLKDNAYCYASFDLLYGNLTIAPGMTSQIDVRCEPIPRKYDTGFILLTIFISIFILLVIICTIYKRYQTEFKNNKKQSKFINIFDISNNWNDFIKLRNNNKLNFLDGIRVWSMFWVIYGHTWTMYVQFNTVSNGETLLPTDSISGPARNDYNYVANKLYMTIAFQGLFSVDSFFWLAGLLAAFSIMRQLDKYGKKVFRLSYKWMPMSIIIRFLRIAPMMMFAVLLQWKYQDQISNGYKIASRNVYNESCNNAWYKILLFYQNFEFRNADLTSIEGIEEFMNLNCMAHLWYLQCDMQMFIFLPLICLIYWFNNIFGIIFSIIPTLITIILRFYFGYYYKFSNSMFLPAQEIQNGGSYEGDSYFIPWMRAAPYFTGVTTMFTILYITKLNKTNYKLKITEYWFHIISGSFILLFLVFIPHTDIKNAPTSRWSPFIDTFYYAISRPLWGLGLSFLCYGIYFKPNKIFSIINQLLSFNIYQPMGKLTFTMYLIHFPIFYWWSNDLQKPIYYTFWDTINLFFGVSVITFFISFLLWFIIEKPLANMITLLLKKINGGGIKKKGIDNGGNMKIFTIKESLITKDGEYSNKHSNSSSGNGQYDSLATNGLHKQTIDRDQTLSIKDI